MVLADIRGIEGRRTDPVNQRIRRALGHGIGVDEIAFGGLKPGRRSEVGGKPGRCQSEHVAIPGVFFSLGVPDIP